MSLKAKWPHGPTHWMRYCKFRPLPNQSPRSWVLVIYYTVHIGPKNMRNWFRQRFESPTTSRELGKCSCEVLPQIAHRPISNGHGLLCNKSTSSAFSAWTRLEPWQYGSKYWLDCKQWSGLFIHMEQCVHRQPSFHKMSTLAFWVFGKWI